MLVVTAGLPTRREWLQRGAISAVLFVLEIVLVERNVFLGWEEGVRDGIFRLCRDDLGVNLLPYVQTGLIAGDPARPYLSLAALVTIALAVLAAALLLRRRIWSLLFLGAAIAGGAGLSTALKEVIVRPGTWSPGGHTFPSGHACVAMTLFLTMIYFLRLADTSPRRREGWQWVLVALLGLSALSILTFHYPTELVGGYLLACGWWSLLRAMLSRPVEEEWSAGLRHEEHLNVPSVY